MERLLLNVMEQINQKGSRYQKLKKVIVVKEEWTTENELLTPSLKMKRNALTEKYEDTLRLLYENPEKISWE